MNDKKDKEEKYSIKKQDALSIFKGLGEKGVSELFKRAVVKKLGEGDILIKEKTNDPSMYVILEGEMKVVDFAADESEGVVILEKGQWVGKTAATRKVGITARAVASCQTSVMVIEEGTIDMLDEKSQLYFYRQLRRFQKALIRRIEEEESVLLEKNKKIAEHMFRMAEGAKSDYGKSEFIMNIINKVPRLPPFVYTLADKLLEGEASVQEVTGIIKGDPSLVADILKAANSPYYGFRRKIPDIDSAVLYLGFRELYQLVIAEGIRSSMPDTPNSREFHTHSVAISHFAFILSQEAKTGTPVQLATIGLLHNIGSGVIELLKIKNPSLGVLLSSLDAAQMGQLLLKEWGLPELLWKSVKFQSYPEFCLPEKIPDEAIDNVSILYLAHLCYDYYNDRSEDDMPLCFFNEYVKRLGWRGMSVSEIADKKALPGLVKKMQTLPAFLRGLLEKYT